MVACVSHVCACALLLVTGAVDERHDEPRHIHYGWCREWDDEPPFLWHGVDWHTCRAKVEAPLEGEKELADTRQMIANVEEAKGAAAGVFAEEQQLERSKNWIDSSEWLLIFIFLILSLSLSAPSHAVPGPLLHPRTPCSCRADERLMLLGHVRSD